MSINIARGATDGGERTISKIVNMKDRDFLLIQGDMLTRLHLRGASRDLFAIIYNVTKDGIHTYQASTEHIAEWLGVSERQVMDLIKNLIESGYINRVGSSETKFSRHKTYEYTTNYEELLQRSYAGEDIRPIPLKRRAKEGGVAGKKGGETSPFLENAEKGGETSPKRVVKLPEKGGETSPTNKGYNSITKDSTTTPAREARPFDKEEEKIFYKILFFRNADDPAAAVERMVGCFISQGWKSKDGKNVYDTPEKRAGLAYGWILNGTGRLPVSTVQDERRTKKFYGFLSAVYDIAAERGGLDPMLVIDRRSRYRVNGDGGIVWTCRQEVARWIESQPDVREIITKHLGRVNLYYEYAA